MKKQGKYLTPFQRKKLEKDLQENLSDKRCQRIKIMLLADDGKTQGQICQELGCSQATAKNWILMAKTNQGHNWKSQPIGRPIKVSEEYRKRLKKLVTQCPKSVNIPHTEYKYPFSRWTAKKLSQHLKEELGIEVTPQHINKILKEMGISTKDNLKSKSEEKVSKNRIKIADLDSVAPINFSQKYIAFPDLVRYIFFSLSPVPSFQFPSLLYLTRMRITISSIFSKIV